MAKKEANVCTTCGQCKPSLYVFLIVGILLLLKDLAVVDYTFGIQWYTALFVLIPVHAIFCKCSE